MKLTDISRLRPSRMLFTNHRPTVLRRFSWWLYRWL